VYGLAAAGGDVEVQDLEFLAGFCVRELRTAQSIGPYMLAGECTGGSLAYEIAQQLRAAGEDIAFLGLVDSFRPGMPTLRSHVPPWTYRCLHNVRILVFHFGRISRLGTRDKLRYMWERIRRGLLERANRVRDRSGPSPKVAFARALAAYEPIPYGGSMVLFRSARLPLGIEPAPDLGWGRLVDNLQIEIVPGYFTTPISEPGAAVLADKLAAHLMPAARTDRADSATSTPLGVSARDADVRI
jgi:thioesterase domain-containing protein